MTSGFVNFDGEEIGVREKIAPPAAPMSDYRSGIIRKLVSERVRRGREPTKLYEPFGPAIDFHKSQAKQRILYGSNRSGKTTGAMLDLAWVAMNRHPYRKCPKGGLLLAVGKDENHIANVMWKKLAFANPEYRMIKDDETGHYRSYRPWTDAHRKDESEPMPPMLPSRVIKRVVWRDAGVGAPQKVILNTDWEILFFTAGGSAKPPQGLTADGCYFDEEIPQPDFYDECMFRLVDRGGFFVWSATPQRAGPKMWNLHLEALKELEKPPKERRVEEFYVTLEDNPYIAQSEKEFIKKSLEHDDIAYRVRVLGQFLMETALTYPMFSRNVNTCEAFEIPSNWCRYAAIDPGFTVAAVIFFAVPPEGNRAYVYDELMIRQCSSEGLAKEMRHRTMGKRFHAFLIDEHGSKRTEVMGESIREQYQKAFEKYKVRSSLGYGFISIGGGEVRTVTPGVHKVRDWLLPTEEDGKPRLIVFNHCHGLIRDIESLHNKIKNGVASETPDEQSKHAAAALRYGVMHGLKYVKPRKRKKKDSPTKKILKQFLGERKKGRKAVRLAAGVG